MPKLGLIGKPLDHSKSPELFQAKFNSIGIAEDWTYLLYPLDDISEITGLWQNNPELVGLNVTVPYKQTVIPYLEEISTEAAEIGAVNTLVKQANSGNIFGYNTDVIGFKSTLVPHLLSTDTDALILGTGGSSKAVQYVLRELGINYYLVSRYGGEGILKYSQLNFDVFSTCSLIINCTPVGMSPLQSQSPAIPYQHINAYHLLYDMVYNPEQTNFLARGKPYGARIVSGLGMLQVQADAAWDLWSTIHLK